MEGAKIGRDDHWRDGAVVVFTLTLSLSRRGRGHAASRRLLFSDAKKRAEMYSFSQVSTKMHDRTSSLPRRESVRERGMRPTFV